MVLRESTEAVCNIVVSDKYLELVGKFVYLGSGLTRDGKAKPKIERWENIVNSINGGLKVAVAS